MTQVVFTFSINCEISNIREILNQAFYSAYDIRISENNVQVETKLIKEQIELLNRKFTCFREYLGFKQSDKNGSKILGSSKCEN
jgi:hypothetical protein